MSAAGSARPNETRDPSGKVRRKHRLAGLTWALAAFTLLGVTSALIVYEALFRPGPELVLLGQDGGELLRLPLRGDPTWEVRWTDPETSNAVRDVFALREGRMLLTDSLTPDLRVAGLERRLELGELRDDGDGGYWIAEIDDPIPENVYPLEVGSDRASTTLVHGTDEHDLSARYAGQSLRLEVRSP